MRTTIDLPQELFRRAKASAAARGESLKNLLTRAVAAEVGHAHDAAARPRVKLPLFGDPHGPLVDLSGRDLEGILADEDAIKAGARRRRRRR